MNTGMLWFDNDPRLDFLAKVNRAIDYYQKKYGSRPDLCYVHPSMLKDGKPMRNGIDIRPNRYVLPNHMWIGKNELVTVS